MTSRQNKSKNDDLNYASSAGRGFFGCLASKWIL